jgi:hypothetical protein
VAYSGKFTPTNPRKYRGDPSKIVYRSLWERHCFKWADSNSNVKSWSSEEVVVPYIYDIDKRSHRYFVDLKITFQDDETWLIEVKPYKETNKPVYPGKKTKKYLNESLTYIKNQNKWKAAKKYAEERKWKWVIWTENELHALGIMMKAKPFAKTKALPGKKAKPFPTKKKSVAAKKMKPFPDKGK